MLLYHKIYLYDANKTALLKYSNYMEPFIFGLGASDNLFSIMKFTNTDRKLLRLICSKRLQIILNEKIKVVSLLAQRILIIVSLIGLFFIKKKNV